MRGLPESDAQHSGSDCHRYIDALIRGSGDLDVVSPYISRGYAEMLARHAARHRVRVITSGARQNDGAMVVFRGGGAGWKKAAAFLALLAAISAALGLWYAMAITTAMAIVAVAAAVAARSRRVANLRVKVSRNVFIHEKLYICEAAAISGSANLTFSGTRRNLEHIDIAVSMERVDALRRHFEELWSSL